MSSLRHRTIDVGGIRLHTAEQGAGPAVVMGHGFPGFWYGWRNQERDPVQQLSGPDPFQAMRDTVRGLDAIHIVPGAGHFVQMEAAEQVNEIMLAFQSKFG